LLIFTLKVTEQKQNPEAFSRMTKESCEKKYSDVEKELEQRIVELGEEKKKQEINESLLSHFHTECKEYQGFVDQTLKHIAQDTEGIEEEKLEKLEKIWF